MNYTKVLEYTLQILQSNLPLRVHSFDPCRSIVINAWFAPHSTSSSIGSYGHASEQPSEPVRDVGWPQ